jgi:hypothetical protein
MALTQRDDEVTNRSAQWWCVFQGSFDGMNRDRFRQNLMEKEGVRPPAS